MDGGLTQAADKTKQSGDLTTQAKDQTKPTGGYQHKLTTNKKQLVQNNTS